MTCNTVFLVKKSYYNVCVGVQFYPWFKSYFPWFWCMVMYNNEYTRLPIENYKTVNPKSGCGHLIKGGGYLQGVLPTEVWQTGKNFGILDTGCGHLNACIRHFHISQNTLCLPPPKFCLNFLFNFPWVLQSSQKTFWGSSKVYYGGCANNKCNYYKLNR